MTLLLRFFFLWSATLVFSLSFALGDTPTRIALVYSGPGACAEGCAEAAADVARRAGLEPHLIRAEEVRPELLRQAALWIQPGGDAIEVARLLSPQQKQWLRDFVNAGGGYIGFCAGAFLADAKVDNENTVEGLGFIPGTTRDRRTDGKALMLALDWRGKPRHVYFEGGAYFEFPNNAPVNVIATYEDGKPATIAVRYGRGRVVVTGPHPEAPDSWKEAAGLEDPDGPDFDLADDMLRSALASRTAD